MDLKMNIDLKNINMEDIKAKVFRASELNLKTSGASSIYEIIKKIFIYLVHVYYMFVMFCILFSFSFITNFASSV